MPRRLKSTSPQTQYDVLREEIDDLKLALQPLKAAGPTHIQTVAISQHANARQGELVFDHVSELVYVRHHGEWIPLGSPYAKLHIKCASDLTAFIAGDGIFKTAISDDMDGYELFAVSAYVSTVGSSGILIQISNRTQGVDMLSTRISIDTGEYDSYTAATPPVINTTNAIVNTSDRIWIDVDASGTSAMGLGVRLFFRRPGVI